MKTVRTTFVVLLLSALLGTINAECYCDDYGYCSCYTPVYQIWWFWVIVCSVAILKFTCIACCVQRRRRRMQMYYVPAPAATTQTTVSNHTTITLPTPSAHPQYMPPPYPGNAPPTYPHSARPMMNHLQPQWTMDTRVEKDTRMLVG